MKKLLRKFKNLKYRYKLTLLILASGLIPVAIIVVYMQYGMMNLLHGNIYLEAESTALCSPCVPMELRAFDIKFSNLSNIIGKFLLIFAILYI